MEINEIVGLIEDFAPLETQEAWDCSGFQIDFGSVDINKILLCLSVTDGTINQAIEKKCDMIIAHHPLFNIPLKFNKGIPVYSAHTNLDKAQGGTTDSLIELLGFDSSKKVGDFLRVVALDEKMSLDNLIKLIKDKLNLKTARVVNNFDEQEISQIAFCAGSGANFISDAEFAGVDAIVTGDVKYHQALESNVIILDIGHFESEHPVLFKVKNLLNSFNLEVIVADEKSPFINY